MSKGQDERENFKNIVRERLFDRSRPNELRPDIDTTFFRYVHSLDSYPAATLTWVAAVEIAFESGNSLLQVLLRDEIEKSLFSKSDLSYTLLAPLYLARQMFSSRGGDSPFRMTHTEEVLGYLLNKEETFDTATRLHDFREESRLHHNRRRSDEIAADVSRTVQYWEQEAAQDLKQSPDIAVYLARHHLYPGFGALPSASDLQKGRLFPQTVNSLANSINARQTKGDGKQLELLGVLFLASLPGYVVEHNVQSAGFQIDVIARHYVGLGDFRDLHGRDILCECKDERSPVGLDAVAKLFAVLEANDVQLGILLTRCGLTTRKEERNARDLLRRLAAKSGRYVMAIVLQDLVDLANSGGNTVEFLRKKFYEARSY